MGWNAIIFLFRGLYMLSFALPFCSTIVTCWQFVHFLFAAHHLPHFPAPPPKKRYHPITHVLGKCFRGIFFQQINRRKKGVTWTPCTIMIFSTSPSSMGSSWFHISTWVYQDPNLCWPKLRLIDDTKNIAHPGKCNLVNFDMISINNPKSN